MGVAMGYQEDEFSATIAMTTPKFDRVNTVNREGEYKERIGDF